MLTAQQRSHHRGTARSGRSTPVATDIQFPFAELSVSRSLDPCRFELNILISSVWGYIKLVNSFIPNSVSSTDYV